jgi:hypothetical protein
MKDRYKMGLKGMRNGSKMDEKWARWVQNGSKRGPKMDARWMDARWMPDG